MSRDRVADGIRGAKPALRVVATGGAGSDGPDMGGVEPPPPPLPPDDDRSAGAWDDPPFEVLGKAGLHYWFIDRTGEIIALHAAALGQWPSLVTLCGGEDWLKTHWRATDREGNPLNAFNARKAGIAIMTRAAAEPLFDEMEPRRRYGLWPVPGGAALHLGRRVLWCGAERDAGFRDAGGLWPRLAPRPAPAAPAAASVAADLETLLRRWNWAHADGPAVLLGIIANGMLGGCSPWRAHAVVIGMEGSGKTTLLRDVVAPLCPLTRYLNSYTEAGLRQMLSETAAALILDEADSASGRDDMMLQRVIEMLRRASSGSGLQAVKGGSDHSARQFSVTASAVLGAILPPPLTPQDASRFTVLQLNPLQNVTDIDDILQFVAKLGPAIWGRMVAGVDRVRALFPMLRRHLIARGNTPRNADQLAIIAAARWVLVEDADPRDDPEELGEPLACVEWLIEAEADRLADSGGNQALQRLLAAPADMSGDKLTLGQLLDRARELPPMLRAVEGRDTAAMTAAEQDLAKDGPGKLAQAKQLLSAHGVRWGRCPLEPPPDSPVDAPPPPIGLYVAVSAHPRLTRVFTDTPWAAQRWGAALQQLPGALSSKAVGTIRMGGGKPRCCWVPWETLAKLL